MPGIGSADIRANVPPTLLPNFRYSGADGTKINSKRYLAAHKRLLKCPTLPRDSG
jgi:hypothetical protein